MSVGVVVDAGASMPVGPGSDGYDTVQVVPMPVEVERGDLASRAGPARRAERVSTSAPSPGAFVEAIEAADQGEGVVVLTVAQRLSASFESARAAVSLASEHHDLRLVDSASATAGEALVVLAACRRAGEGGDLEAVAAAAQAAAGGVRLVAQDASLEVLARSGRLPPGALTASRLTGMRPVFELAQGSIRPLPPAFSLAGAERRILSSWRRSRGERGGGGTRPVLHLAALHAGEAQSAQRLIAAVSDEVEPESAFVGELSPLMLAHTGSGVSGLSWWWER